MKKALALFLALWPLAAVGARAELDCTVPAKIEAPIDGPLEPAKRVEDYRPILKSCAASGRKILAIRFMRVDGEDLLLAVDPQRLDTSLERAACWKCGEPQGA